LFDTLQHCIQTLHSEARPEKISVPAFYWHGFDNQYHRWLTGFVTGDLGLSRSTQKPVWESLKFSLRSTLIINGLAILLAYCLAVPLGVFMARRRDQAPDRTARWVLLLLYSMPIFWLGSLLMLFFATPDFGLYIINGIGIESYQGSGKTYGAWCLSNFDKFILPILTLGLHALAVLALQMRGGVLDTIGQDFVRTARAKGASENAVYWRQAFRNALFPIITIFASVFPAIFTGSLVVEFLFQFPGLGMKTSEAFMGGDYPVLFTILMLAAMLTILGSLVADLLYALADPRVRFA
jgi:peptide/nickel transport system permease protein